MRSFFALALCLSLVHISDARVSKDHRIINARSSTQGKTVLNWLWRLIRREEEKVNRRQDGGICYEDEYYNFVYNSTDGQTFCQAFYAYPNQTVTTDFTPTATYTDLASTETIIHGVLERTTPLTTVTETVTAAAKNKRDPQITNPPLMPRDLSQAYVDEFIANYKRQVADNSTTNSTTADDAQLSASFSSACSCQTYAGSTITVTYTDEPTVATLTAYTVTTLTTTTSTTTAGELTSTILITDLIVTASTTPTTIVFGTAPSGTSTNMTAATATVASAVAPTPTAPIFTCPDDDNTTVSQLVGNERFDYLILCDTDLTNPDVYDDLYYDTFSECVAACSVSDRDFDYPVCQGVSYFSANNSQGYNCFLKSSQNGTVSAPGVDSALLVSIAIGISPSDPAGTYTENEPFAGPTPTQNASMLSSSFAAFLANSTSTMPFITPAPAVPASGMLVNPGSTYYSVDVVNGSTYYSATTYSTYISANGTWYESYYTSFTEAWAASTTVEQVSEATTSVTNSSSETIEESSGGNGESTQSSITTVTTPNSNGYNETVTNSTVVKGANGTVIFSTAVTSYYSYETTASGSTNSSINGGSGSVNGSGSGIVGSTAAFVTSTAVVISSGSTAGSTGGAAYGAVNSSAATIVNSYGTAYSTGYVISGVAGSTGETVLATTSVAVVVNSYGTAGSSGSVVSGVVYGTAGSNGTVLSGVVPSSGSPTPSYTNTAGGYGASPSTTPTSSPNYSFSYSNGNRTDVPTKGTAPLATGPSPYSPYNQTGYPTGTAPLSTALPSYSFSAPGAPRGPGSSSSSTPSATAPAVYTTNLTGSGAPTTSMNTTSTSSTSYSFGAYGQPRGSGSISTKTHTWSPSGYPHPSGTAPSGYFPYYTPLLPTAATTCANATQNTVTVVTTTTVYGCASTCSIGGGYYAADFQYDAYAHAA